LNYHKNIHKDMILLLYTR